MQIDLLYNFNGYEWNYKVEVSVDDVVDFIKPALWGFMTHKDQQEFKEAFIILDRKNGINYSKLIADKDFYEFMCKKYKNDAKNEFEREN